MAAGRSIRQVATDRVADYHEACLIDLVNHLTDQLNNHRAEATDVHDADAVIHQYHRAARELWKFCFASGGDIEFTASLIDQHTQPVDWWQRGAPRQRR